MKFTPPIKLVFKGDESAGQMYIKFAKKQLGILEQQMKFQGLNEGRRIVSPIHGVFVECVSSFSYHAVAIHTPTAVQEGGGRAFGDGEKEYKQPKIEEDYPVVYFTRIKYPDSAFAPYSPDLDMDRIIIWEMSFDSVTAEVVDPEDSANRGGGFVPGQGTVILDADVINNVVYFPEGLGPEETENYLARARKYLSGCPSQIEPNSNIKDKAPLWFTSGDLADPVYMAELCNHVDDDSMEETFFYEIGDSYITPSSFEYRPIVYDGVYDNGTTHNFWISENCGYVLAAYNENIWPSLPTNSVHYGEFSHTKITGETEVIDTFMVEGGLLASSGDYNEVWYWTADPSPYDGYGLEIGIWYTPFTEKEYPSFFIASAKKHVNTMDGPYSTLSIACFSWNDITGQWDYEESAWQHDVKMTAGPGETVIRTPLEGVEGFDFLLFHELGGCSELPCWFDAYRNFWFISTGFQNAYPYLRDYIRCPLSTDPDNYYDNLWYKAERTILQDSGYVQYDVHIPDPSVVDNEGQRNFFSLRYLEEARQVNQKGVETYSGQRWCNDEQILDVSGVITGKDGYVGFIIYILAPERWETTNQATGEIEYWDVHSARRDSATISPYRCLDLEEYLNNVVYGIQQMLDGRTDIEKLTEYSDCAKSLKFYGYGITDGFIRRV